VFFECCAKFRVCGAPVAGGSAASGCDGLPVPNYPCVLMAVSCNETDPEYELRFDADEEYLLELIDRIDEMSLRGVKLCKRFTEMHPGKWQGNSARRSARTASRMLSDILFCRRGGATDE
jgi:hypothetical protein